MPSHTTYPTVDQHKAALAAEAWGPLIDFIVATGPRRSHVFGELGLTPNDGRALGSLDPAIGRSMRSLADEWGCDASTATWAIDRLVAKGLAERRAHDRDRRITLVTLTAAGDETGRRLRALVHVPPPELLELSEDDLVALREAAKKLPGLGRD
jgi:DNA-binding MarR family transcriptional regulator